MWLSKRLFAGGQSGGSAPATVGASGHGLAIDGAALPQSPVSLPLPVLSPPLDVDALRTLEECAFNAWPAQRIATVNGWVLRLSEGYTKRANSANALCPTGSFKQTRALAESFYARHDQPAIFRLSPLAGGEADAALADAGYQRTGETLVLCVPLAPRAGGLASRIGIAGIGNVPHHDEVQRVMPHADAAWRLGYAQAADVPETARALHDRLLDAIAMPCGFAAVGPVSSPVGFGMGVVERDLLGLFDIVVHPMARRQGAARRLMAQLMAWGRARGARQAYLQVVADNAPAISLYRALGFCEAYRYHYRIAPP